ncbi:hypothetical protein [Loktanella sp. Alg231-35]|uniref:hypothetical protein n=1 Tax=Loktanella sp. Alg231-35 TaxID=1922220 RepID=UPI000D55E5A2|nr:hypothetical protein [Loktanella sp. Alg231-35]
MAAILGLLPKVAMADMLELSQEQMRQLVAQQQVLGTEAILTDASATFGGDVMDIRGFLSEGRMTYRLLLKRGDGSVVELLYNGVNGQRVSHNSEMGQSVSKVAQSSNGNSGGNGNSGNNGNGNGNSGNNGNGNGNSGNNGNGNGRGN